MRRERRVKECGEELNSGVEFAGVFVENGVEFVEIDGWIGGMSGDVAGLLGAELFVLCDEGLEFALVKVYLLGVEWVIDEFDV